MTLVSMAGFLWLSVGCRQANMITQVKPEISIPRVELAIPLEMPTDSASTCYEGLQHPLMVYQVYKTHDFHLIWLRDSIPDLADSMMYFVRNVRFNGLLPQDYHDAELTAITGASLDPKLLYRKEALLTDAFLAIALDLKYGRIIERTDLKVIDSLALAVLENALSRKQISGFLELQEPQHLQYQLLKNSLRGILNDVDSSDRRVLLSGVTYDSVELYKNVQRIEVNMERWRSDLTEFADRYTWINIPAYQLRVIEGARTVLESRVIVGTPDTPTPTFNSTVESISFYPYWRVPRKIAVEELLPAIRQDTSYLRRHNFEVLDKNGAVRNPATLEWKMFNEDYFPFSLRQREGTGNSLGIIKFVFDNPYAVFLHDTNARQLFRRDFRALSHGCVRMEKAVELARYLVPDPAQVDKRIEQKKQATIGIKRPIQIYIRYLTCEVTDNILKYYDDVYGLDQAMIKLLYTPDRATSASLRSYGMITR